ncbi:MAG: ATP-dependent Clp protease adaptor ClpS [Chlorobi bacterium]|nr:ATP-dependent Clp protease adaptor ClpS [Chlorobiota bacterium]
MDERRNEIFGTGSFLIKGEEERKGIFEYETDEETSVGLPFKVLLFNDDWHTFEEVIVQLIKAVRCTFDEARAYAFEVHVKGKAAVFAGPLNECLKVTSILEEIALNTQIITDE